MPGMKRIFLPILALAVVAALLFPTLPDHTARAARETAAQRIDALLSQRIKHVFIIYQENRSFDNEFGTFPGADGVWSKAARSHGFAQRDPATGITITPFRSTSPDVYYESNARAVQLRAFDHGKMDRFVSAQEKAVLHYEPHATKEQLMSVGAGAMSHLDCGTIPLLWAYAHRFTLFDRFFQALRGPSTPSNIEIIAAQDGLTQLARHPNERAPSINAPGEPIFTDIDPAFGPYNPHDSTQKPRQIDQTYATILLDLQRSAAPKVSHDNADIRADEAQLARLGGASIPWRWYQEGYAQPQRLGFITHHAAPQYFGYVVKNQQMHSNMRGLSQFYDALSKHRLPASGVIYLKAGSHSILGLLPANSGAYVRKHFQGDDDHPGYTDAQLSEAFVAATISAIAKSPYWKDSAIILTWDDSGGYWDHVSPHAFERCPDGHPCGDGARVPALVISPYAKSAAVVHDFNDQTSVLKFIETVFGLPSLASLPDEKPFLPQGPRDGNALLSNLRGAFDLARLQGTKATIPWQQAYFPTTLVRAIPSRLTCSSIGVRPVAPPPGISDAPPRGWSPLPFAKQPQPH